MENLVNKQPLCISTHSTVGPYLTLPEAQLEKLRSILDQHGIRYRVDEGIISLNGEPEEALVFFGRDGTHRQCRRSWTVSAEI